MEFHSGLSRSSRRFSQKWPLISVLLLLKELGKINGPSIVVRPLSPAYIRTGSRPFTLQVAQLLSWSVVLIAISSAVDILFFLVISWSSLAA